jgi:hypothetical protein
MSKSYNAASGHNLPLDLVVQASWLEERKKDFYKTHVTSPLRAQQVNAIYRFVTMVNEYNYHIFGHYPSSCLLLKTQLNSVGLSVPHRKHITSPLQVQQVNAIYRFVTTVY